MRKYFLFLLLLAGPIFAQDSLFTAQKIIADANRFQTMMKLYETKLDSLDKNYKLEREEILANIYFFRGALELRLEDKNLLKPKVRKTDD